MIPVMIVPTLNQHDLCRQMIASIDVRVDHLLIINNDSSNDFWCDKNEMVAEVRVLNMPSNLGVSSSWNLGIKSYPFAPWWLICSDDVTFHPGALEKFASECGPDALVCPTAWPNFQFFGVGERVIDLVGLFDEALHPANFEDDDFLWRVEALEEEMGVRVELIDVPHEHVKQATVFSSEYVALNDQTYASNEFYFNEKQAMGDVTSGEWQLRRRRDNDWDH
jgi:glycosyltransferase involved in cell wall biosynthesis